MCKIGDILLIYNARNGRPVGAHPFMVLDDRDGIIRGSYAYDFIGLLMTSANTEEKRARLRKVEGNFPISQEDKHMNLDKTSDNRYSYIEADQFFYFEKDRIKYIKIGFVDPDIYTLIVEFIEELARDGTEFAQILDKAKRIDI